MQGQLPFSKSWGRQGMHSLGSPKEMLFNPFGMTSFPLIHQEHCSEWDHLKKDTHTVPLHKCHTQAALAEGHTEQQGNTEFHAGGWLQGFAAHPEGATSPFPPFSRRRSEESPGGSREGLCLSKTNRGTQCWAGGLQPQKMRSCSRRTGQGPQQSCCPPAQQAVREFDIRELLGSAPHPHAGVTCRATVAVLLCLLWDKNEQS